MPGITFLKSSCRIHYNADRCEIIPFPNNDLLQNDGLVSFAWDKKRNCIISYQIPAKKISFLRNILDYPEQGRLYNSLSQSLLFQFDPV